MYARLGEGRDERAGERHEQGTSEPLEPAEELAEVIVGDCAHRVGAVEAVAHIARYNCNIKR